jgi:hypothetical protein
MRQRKGKRLPSYDELLAAAERVSARSDERQAMGDEVAVAGGLAMQVWGSPRLTADLDVIANDRLGYTGEPLSFGGVRTREGTVPLDVIVRDDEWRDLYVAALMSAVMVDNITPPVVTPEFLVAMKMVAGRPKDEADVRYLVLTEDFDREVAESVVRQYLGAYAVKELRSLIAEAERRRSRGEEP